LQSPGKQWIQVRILIDTKNQKKHRLRGLGKMMVAVIVILFLLFFSISLISPIKPELIGWENGRPIDNTFKTR